MVGVDDPDTGRDAETLQGLAGEFLGFVGLRIIEAETGEAKDAAGVQTKFVVEVQLRLGEDLKIFFERSKSLEQFLQVLLELRAPRDLTKDLHCSP